MSNGIYGIGLSGLAAAQAGLLTAGHNISNVNTPGYSRQETIQSNALPLFTGSGYIGTGVDVVTVRRVYNDYLAAQLAHVASGASQLDTYSTELSKLDNLFGDPSAGLSPAMNSFFSAVNALAQHPADTPSRQALLASAQALVSSLRQQDDQLGEIRTANNRQIASAVATINADAKQIADLNRRIAEAQSAGTQKPNDLLDQRDQLVKDLNTQIGATAVVQSDGSYNVFLSNGQGLVVGVTAGTLVARPNPDDPQNFEVGLQNGSNVLRFNAQTLSGGALGGLLAFRDGDLTDAQNALGRIAVTLASAVNAQQHLGVDLTGALGGDLFTVPAPTIVNATGNTGSGTVAASIQDATALQASDYRLSYDGSNYTLTRLSDGNAQTFASLPQTVDGLTFTVSGTPAAGDRFLIQATRNVPGTLAVAISDPARIAAAGPVVTGVSSANAGAASIGGASVDSTYPSTPLGGALTLQYTSATGTLGGFPPGASVTVTLGGASTTYAPGVSPPYTDGATYSFDGVSFTMSGTPADGDTFTVSRNVNGTNDNRNAQAMAALASQNLVANRTTTFAGAFGELVATVGDTANSAQTEQTAQAALLAQATAQQQTVSGVNLDEEAANLQKYQQAYQASAKVLAIAGTLFDAILSIAAGSN
jgi:flagellar hook-associated protein 1 FlgK